MSNVPVIVTEEVKTATAALLGYHDWADANDYRLTGRQDRTVEATVQAFARHRIAATSTLQDQVEAYRGKALDIARSTMVAAFGPGKKDAQPADWVLDAMIAFAALTQKDISR